MPDAPIAYILKRFPRFSETFILNELLAHEEAGAATRVYSLLAPPDEPRHARLAKLKAEVMILKAHGKGQDGLPPSGDEALFSGKNPQEIGALLRKVDAIAADAQAQGITHFHAHFGSDTTTVACLAARAIGGTFSFTAHAKDIYHTYVTPEADAEMRRAKLRQAAFVATVSDYNARHLSDLCPEARIIRLYNGIDLAAFKPVAPAGQQPGHLIAVGRMVAKKGFDVLLDACALLRARNVPFFLSLVGSGPLEETLRAQRAALGLQDIVSMDGPLPQEALIDKIGTAQAAVLPCVITESGDRDGLPTVLLEAMARGLPVVTTTVSGGPEIVMDGLTGRLCAPGDATSLGDALEDVLAVNERAHLMGKAGRRRAEELFDLKINAGRLRKLIRDPARATHEAA
ncbi:MAG: glycosyltransferase [Rhodobacteraceae bacterium]|nr:glycosyltransferase [Paracoccaceae bacterium]